MHKHGHSEQRQVVYNFFAGFRPQAESMYGWLLHEGLNPAWDFRPVGRIARTAITLPVSELDHLHALQESDPERWGEAPRAAA